jgi:hypothetical protein
VMIRAAQPLGACPGGRAPRQNWGKFEAHKWGGFTGRLDADDDGVLGRRHIEPDHVGSLGDDELRIVALALGFAPGKVDLLRTQEAPDILDLDIAQRSSQQWPRPAGITLGRHLIQQRQDAFVRLRRILRLGAPIARFVETRKPLLGIADPPLRDRTDGASNCASNRPTRYAVRSQKHDPSPQPQTPPRAPNDRDRRPPPSSKCQVSLQGCRSCILESRLIHQR